ncbi:MAG: hypothetical protein KF708_21195 [Pirellulales bacterium]|nr:hypothetical protein [Pirellulales bacterium]
MSRKKSTAAKLLSASTASTLNVGRRRTTWRIALRVTAVLVVVLMIAGYYGAWRMHAKRLLEIEPGVLYRVGQPTEWGFHYLVVKRGVKTVVSFQTCDVQLRHGPIDPGKPSGADEREYVQELGAEHLQWPWGEEAYWPWPTPWVFEEFFHLMDSPERQPVAIHCAGGRHRTGSMAALYRLEYDRWPIDRVLREMYSYDFGPPVPLHEHNLRTYTPRPRPSDAQGVELIDAFGQQLPQGRLATYEELVRALREARRGENEKLEQTLEQYMAEGRAFSLPLAARLIDSPADSLVDPATSRAAAMLGRSDGTAADWSTAAALIADFGNSEQQLTLLKLLSDEQQGTNPSDRYRALVAGVTNRYTANRIPYLDRLLDDKRQRVEPEAAGYRYCDTAAARLAVIVNADFLSHATSLVDPFGWQYAVQEARQWIADHAGEAQLGHLVPPGGRNEVRHVEANDGTFELRR